MKKPKTPYLTVDGLVVEKGKVLMIKRAHFPFVDSWVLPGGHVEYGETTEKAVKREMKEELGVSVKIKKIIGVYSNPKRDPRYHTVTIAYLLKKGKGKIRLNEEAHEFKYFSLEKLSQNIGFDHKEILRDLKRLRNK